MIVGHLRGHAGEGESFDWHVSSTFSCAGRIGFESNRPNAIDRIVVLLVSL